ncbi:HIT domain-containing protein [Jiangella endophytica]|uniref:HIT domain-containing protein n=1 Tax=Jiangella endophytica TaxID=1623398 RepID=UPI000E35635C|nr:HIT domain-containing protein [Jiangella endophytica]
MRIQVPIDDPCAFCEYLAGRRPYTIIDRDALTAVLVTREQRGRGHVLVVPVDHYETIIDVPTPVAEALMRSVQRWAAAIARAHSAEGLAVWQNNGIPAHQSVPHVHFHLAATLPEGGTHWDGVPTLSIRETDAIAETLLAKLDARP